MAGIEDREVPLTTVPLYRDTQPIDVYHNTCGGVNNVVQDNPLNIATAVFPGNRIIPFCPAFVEGKCVAVLPEAPKVEDFPRLPGCPVFTQYMPRERHFVEDKIKFASGGITYTYDVPKYTILSDRPGTKKLILNGVQALLFSKLASNPRHVVDLGTLFLSYHDNQNITVGLAEQRAAYYVLARINKKAKEFLGAKLIFSHQRDGYTLTPPEQ